MKNERNYGLGMVLSIALCALSAAGFVNLPQYSVVMNGLIVFFILSLAVCTFRWMGQGNEKTVRAVKSQGQKPTAEVI